MNFDCYCSLTVVQSECSFYFISKHHHSIVYLHIHWYLLIHAPICTSLALNHFQPIAFSLSGTLIRTHAVCHAHTHAESIKGKNVEIFNSCKQIVLLFYLVFAMHYNTMDTVHLILFNHLH